MSSWQTAALTLYWNSSEDVKGLSAIPGSLSIIDNAQGIGQSKFLLIVKAMIVCAFNRMLFIQKIKNAKILSMKAIFVKLGNTVLRQKLKNHILHIFLGKSQDIGSTKIEDTAALKRRYTIGTIRRIGQQVWYYTWMGEISSNILLSVGWILLITMYCFL